MLSRAEILARMGLDNKPFKNGLRQSQNFARKIVGNMVRAFAPLIGLAGFGGASRAAAQLADDIGDLAIISNASNEEFQKLTAGSEQYGVEMDKLAKIYNNVNKNIGQFTQNGTGPVISFFENIAPLVNLTAEEFRNLSGPEALQLYYNALEEAELPQSEMIFYLETLSTKSSRLIPLLRDNGAEFKRLGEQAQAAGAIMNDETIASLDRANDRITRMKRGLTVLWGEILVKLIPAFQIFSQSLGFIGDVLGVLIIRAIAFGKAFGTVISAVVKPAITAFSALGKVILATNLAMKGNFDAAKTLLNEAKGTFSEVGNEIKAIPDAMKDASDDLKLSVDESAATFKASAEERKKIFQSAIDEFNGKADQESQRIRKEREALEREINALETSGGGSGGGGSQTKRGQQEAKRLSQEADQKRLQMLRLNLLNAEITGKEKLIKAAQKELDLEASIQKIASGTGVSRSEASQLAEAKAGGGKNSGRTSDGRRFETRAGPGGKREKVFFKDGKFLGTADDQKSNNPRSAAASVSGVPDAQTKIKADSAAKSGMKESSESWKEDIGKIREKLDQMEAQISAA